MSEFPIKGWKWIFYIYGWMSGATNLLFWAIMLILFLVNKEKEFISNKFHQRVYVWGLVMGIITVAILVLVLLFVVLALPVLVSTQTS
jgi:hypothetical protein